MDPIFSSSGRSIHTDRKINSDLTDARISNQLFVRLVAKEKRFSNVDFKYSIFETCYLRNCTFNSCDFTGCRFVGTNLVGSSFVGCKFDYVTFERTAIDNDILDSGCPGNENLKMRFARTLRMNFQQLGDARSANKAMGVELEATAVYLYKAWKSNESYYRAKYIGWKRYSFFFQWLGFKLLDWVWGNGENALKLLRTLIILFIFMSALDVFAFKDPKNVGSYGQAFSEMPQIFLGTLSPSHYPSWYLTIILFTRLAAFGFFMSIIIKRFNRR
jgi:hypothetical protein